MKTKICKVCLVSKEVIEFPKAGTYKGETSYRGECFLCNREKQKSPQIRANEKKYKTSEKGRKTRSINRKRPEVRARERKEEMQAYHKGPRKHNIISWQNNQLKTDPVFKAIWYLRNRVRDWAKTKGADKKSAISTTIGMSREEFRKYIASKFQEGMTWDNHGEWEIDHIIPISSATTIQEAQKLTHYSNLQPLWKKDNRDKRDKMPEGINA